MVNFPLNVRQHLLSFSLVIKNLVEEMLRSSISEHATPPKIKLETKGNIFTKRMNITHTKKSMLGIRLLFVLKRIMKTVNRS